MRAETKIGSVLLVMLAIPQIGGSSSDPTQLITTSVVLPLANSVRVFSISTHRFATSSVATLSVVMPPFAEWSADLVIELRRCQA
ncbi:hypothetical protein [Amycolatopsis magusensis]|uniref:Secreted protein n=1 Tax=Amycolatopsis magusensis TaxID=882444 RepID=A0ABS4PTR1_9PSEU|nr:hypothetical protein [Amycolatopsis magusensis]MBP2182807.1 hypothetical protein [Amycolatopsis magusensis]MDI5979906.1 hypothetical protein [Amycolatopsis magusensis]